CEAVNRLETATALVERLLFVPRPCVGRMRKRAERLNARTANAGGWPASDCGRSAKSVPWHLRLSGLAAQGGDAGMVGVSRQSLACVGVLEEVPVKEVHDDLADFGHCGVVHVRTQVRATVDGQQEVGDPWWRSIEQADA